MIHHNIIIFHLPLLLSTVIQPNHALSIANTGDSSSSSSSSSSSTSCTSTTTTTKNIPTLITDPERLRRIISSGRVYQQRHFLSEDDVSLVLNEISDLKDNGAFAPSGLSNTNKGTKQNFGRSDRIVCPVPWWKDSLQSSSDDDDDVDDNNGASSSSSSSAAAARIIGSKLQTLRRELSHLLSRPTLSDDTLDHECYYSQSTPGAYLNRHMDERHEETKGTRGWLLPSRRSLSWLIYLSDEDWDTMECGGALRTFPQKTLANSDDKERGGGVVGGGVVSTTTAATGCHEGNLQVGWMLRDEGDDNKGSMPVFLDSWLVLNGDNSDGVITNGSGGSDAAISDDFHCILYVIDPVTRKRRYVTRPWINDGGNLSNFIIGRARMEEATTTSDISTVDEQRLFLNRNDAVDFRLIEDRDLWSRGGDPEGSMVEDISPERGSLVVFDSVSVPHEVLLVKQKTRTAIAGWFHEQTQFSAM